MTIDLRTSGTTEVRIHGVSGTPPENLLEMPKPWLRPVSGNGRSVFYRRWMPGPTSPETEDGVDRVEAYSWGRLTSGGASRALWLLAMPFTLVNTAHWMLPPVPDPAPRWRRGWARTAVTTLRLLGISLTGTIVLAFSLVCLDLAAWQCAADDRCAAGNWATRLLSHLDSPMERVGVAAIGPGVVLLVLWMVGRSSLAGDTAPDAVVGKEEIPLQHARFWAADPCVTRLRRLHIAFAVSLLASLVLWPQATYASDTRPSGALLGVAVLIVVLSLVGCAAHRVTGRGGETAAWANRPTEAMQDIAVALLITAVALAFLVHPENPADVPFPSHLPGLRGFVLSLLMIQIGLVLLLFIALGAQRGQRLRLPTIALAVTSGAAVLQGIAWWLRYNDGRTDGWKWTVMITLATVGAALAWLVVRAVRTPVDTDPDTAAGGLGPALVVNVAWGMSGAFAAGLGLQVAQWFGQPVTSTELAATSIANFQKGIASTNFADAANAYRAEYPLIVPPAYVWAGVGAVVVALVAVGLVAWLFMRRIPQRTLEARADVVQDYPDVPRPGRVARARAIASLTDDAGTIIGALVTASLAMLVIGIGFYGLSKGATEKGPLALLAGIGSWLITAIALALIGLGYASVRNEKTRRTVGILWDVMTFWPRANHPLTPPSYAERALGDLRDRIGELTETPDDHVVIAGHSQGSVLAFTAVLRLPEENVDRVALLTFGSPVRRLYRRWFPAYFGATAWAEVHARLDTRWHTLYRLTDPIGSWNVAVDPGRSETYDVTTTRARIAPSTQVDMECCDPLISDPDGDVIGHSDYWFDPVYCAAVGDLLTPGRYPQAPSPST